MSRAKIISICILVYNNPYVERSTIVTIEAALPKTLKEVLSIASVQSMVKWSSQAVAASRSTWAGAIGCSSDSLAIRFLSPYTLSTRETDGQNLAVRTHGAGNAACSRVYGWFHSSARTTSAVWGAFFRTLFFLQNSKNLLPFVS